MKTHHLLSFFLAVFLLEACSENKITEGKSLDDCPVVTTMQIIGKDKVTTLHLDRVKDTLDLPVSRLLDNFRIVPLDNRDEALIKWETVFASDNYICTGGTSQEPCRLFDQTGRFICQVGANGQGPGEYWAVYDKYIDEANKRIYLMPWNAKSLLVYDLNGQYLSNIPLPTLAPKGVFAIDTQKELLTVGLLPFNNIEGASVVWQQDFEGNILHRVDAAPYAIEGDYSNEIDHNGNLADGTFDFSIFNFWDPRNDTLYHFITEENRLAPRFTLKQPEKKLQHSYLELPGYYLADITTEISRGEVTDRVYVLIDKKTQKGAYVRILNDLIGNRPIKYASFFFKRGYFAFSMDPGNLLDDIEAALSYPDRLSPKQQEQLKSLQKNVSTDDNNYLFIGKIKSEINDLALNTFTARREEQPAKQPRQTTGTVPKTEATDGEDPDLVYSTATLETWKSYFPAHNKYKDWDPKDPKQTLVGAVIDKQGKPHDLRIIRSSGIKELDEEAVRLIREAPITPAKNKNGEEVEQTNWVCMVHFPPK